MGKGSQFPAEWREFEDLQTGVKVKQLTNYKGHSHHLYFTNSGWYTDGSAQKLLFGSDRCNTTNLFSLDLSNGQIVQLTEFDSGQSDFLFASINPRHPEVYFWHQRSLFALDLHTLEQRTLFHVPDGYAVNMTSVTADGANVCAGIYEDLSAHFKVDLLHGYVGFTEYWQAMPQSKILQISTETGQARTVFVENYWIGHVNASSTMPHIATFCHEGPWDRVDQRIWGIDLRDGRTWKIRPTEPGEQVGHEYWFMNGEQIGYHGRRLSGESFYGSIRYDNSEQMEVSFEGNSMHFHSNDSRLIVGDGTRDQPQLLLWRFSGSQFEGPRVVLTHHGTFQIQQLHVHPRFSPDGTQILFVSDMAGYGSLHLIDTPEFDSLPEFNPKH
jgi:oligogalacturonide lyase